MFLSAGTFIAIIFIIVVAVIVAGVFMMVNIIVANIIVITIATSYRTIIVTCNYDGCSKSLAPIRQGRPCVAQPLLPGDEESVHGRTDSFLHFGIIWIRVQGLPCIAVCYSMLCYGSMSQLILVCSGMLSYMVVRPSK